MSIIIVDQKFKDIVMNDRNNDNNVANICVFRLSSTHPRATLEGTTDMRRCESPQMLLLPPKCSDGLTALKTNTLRVWDMAEQRLSTHTGPETGMEVRRMAWLSNKTLEAVVVIVQKKNTKHRNCGSLGVVLLKIKI